MAASSAAGRVLSLCRRFQNVCGISAKTESGVRVLVRTRDQDQDLSRRPLAGVLSRCSPLSSAAQCRALHTTISRRGLEEFFDHPDNWGESKVKSGSSWTAKQLRTKSNEDLHKLWYVLLKEKNMLLTTQQEAKRQGVQMPSPERVRKIDSSIIRLETVVSERETALRLLQTGQEKGRPGAWRKNTFGFVYWYRFKEYAIPWYMNRRYKRKRFYTPKFVEPYIRLRIEKYLRLKARKANQERKRKAMQLKHFPKIKDSSS